MSRISHALRSPVFWLTAAAGAVAGGILSPGFRQYWMTDLQPWLEMNIAAATTLFLLLGVGTGILVFAALSWLWEVWQGISVATARFPSPWPDAEVRIDRRQQEAGWRIFLELATRVPVQPVTEDCELPNTLSSFQEMSQRIHEELGRAPADRLHTGRNQVGLHAYGLVILNHGLRPCLARWHPRLEQWEHGGRSERDWPWRSPCRKDLETTRQWLFTQTSGLGAALGMANAEKLLRGSRHLDTPELVSRHELEMRERSSSSELHGDMRRSAWRIYVELETRLPGAPRTRSPESLGESLAALQTLQEIVREELKSLGPVHGPVAEIAFRLLNGQLPAFLGEWRPRFHAWEHGHPDMEESAWASFRECRSALLKVRKQLSEESATLAVLLGFDGEPGAVDLSPVE